MRTTHTYALMEVSPATYAEVKAHLVAAGYDHAINDEGELDMHGLALVEHKPDETEGPAVSRRSDNR